jgi:hypothetical protein
LDSSAYDSSYSGKGQSGSYMPDKTGIYRDMTSDQPEEEVSAYDEKLGNSEVIQQLGSDEERVSIFFLTSSPY